MEEWSSKKEEAKKVRSLVRSLRPERVDDKELWLVIGRALHALDSKWLHVWVKWTSTRSEKRARACHPAWQKFRPRTTADTVPLSRRTEGRMILEKSVSFLDRYISFSVWYSAVCVFVIFFNPLLQRRHDD